jgi:hypothetical protein
MRTLRRSLKLGRTRFAYLLYVDKDRIRDVERGTVELKESFWLLTLMTYDPIFRANWFAWLNDTKALPDSQGHY